MRINENVYKTALTGLIAALSYVVFTFLQIKIPLGAGDAVSIHFGNAVCVLGALIGGGLVGGLGGAIGMSIGDLLDPIYIIYAPKTFILKFLIGLITGFIAHRIGHITFSEDQKHVTKYVMIAAFAGLLFNAVADPLLGYYYKILILGKPAADLTVAWNAGISLFNSVTNAVVSGIIYMALRPALIKSGLFLRIGRR